MNTLYKEINQLKIGIIDIEMGNLESVKNALLVLGFQAEFVADAKMLNFYDCVVLPGVGSFPMAMRRLKEKGFDTEIQEYCKGTKPFVGICLGMQLLFNWSDEMGGSEGLSIIPGKVEKIPEREGFAIPHMGWNNVISKNMSFHDNEEDFYFVHSYMCIPQSDKDVLLECEYSSKFCAGVRHGNNVFGFQFHPEKSQKGGLKLIKKVLNGA